MFVFYFQKQPLRIAYLAPVRLILGCIWPLWFPSIFMGRTIWIFWLCLGVLDPKSLAQRALERRERWSDLKNIPVPLPTMLSWSLRYRDCLSKWKALRLLDMTLAAVTLIFLSLYLVSFFELLQSWELQLMMVKKIAIPSQASVVSNPFI